MQINKFWKDTDVILVALSGGMDSVCLFHLLFKQLSQPSKQLKVVHVNHGMRKNAIKDQYFVKKLCEQYQVDYYTNELDSNISLKSEEQARNFRYQFFKKIYMDQQCQWLVTAHHQNDNAETILFKMIRGESLGSISGIKETQIINGMTVYRPLLNYAKKDIQTYVTNEKLLYVNDETNSTKKYTRNRIRLDVLPLLENENKNAIKHITFLAEQLKEQSQIVNDYLKMILPTVIYYDKKNKRNYIDVVEIIKYTKPIQKYVTKYFFELENITLTKALLQKTLILIENQHGEKSISINAFTKVCRSYQKIFILYSSKIMPDDKMHRALSVEEPIITQNFEIKLTESTNKYQFVASSNHKIILRTREAGDYVQFRSFKKKLNRLFIDMKIPKYERNTILVLAQQHQIIGILDERFIKLFESLRIDIIDTPSKLQYISYRKQEENA